MIEEDYCSCDIARLIKEKGLVFAEHTSYIPKHNADGTAELITTITHQTAMKWLREKHLIAIVIDCWFGGDRYISWHGKIMCYGEDLKTQQDVELPYVATYEEAVEAAVKYALINLI